MKLTIHAKHLARCAFNRNGSRPLLVRSYLFDLLGRHVSGLVLVEDGLCYVLPTRDHIAKKMFVTGGFNFADMIAAIEIIPRLTGGAVAGRTFIDIGANLGTTTLPALAVFGASDVIAVEPDPRIYRLLRCTVVANGYEARIRTLQAALSDQVDSLPLEICDVNSGDSRLRLGDATEGLFSEAQRATVQVPVTTFDNLVADFGIDLDRVGLVWMDTQGHEAHVLDGASKLLESSVPVVLEYWPYGLRRVDKLVRLHEVIAHNYSTVVDLRTHREFSAKGVAKLADCYTGVAETDLLLVK